MSQHADESLIAFTKAAVKYVGKEIQLASGQFFSINLLNDKQQNELHIQYGFPQSGGVNVHLPLDGEKKGKISIFSVTAPSSDKPFVSALFDEKKDVGAGINVTLSSGMDMGFDEHDTSEKIEANPNAMKMLEFATDDLNEALVLGNSSTVVAEGSTRTPVGKAV